MTTVHLHRRLFGRLVALGVVLSLATFSLAVACSSRAQVSAAPQKAQQLEVKVLAEFPHDPTAFTQGLLWHEGVLYESTGQYKSSTLRRVDPNTGTVLEQYNLDDNLFGEGLVLMDGRLVQLTWKSGLALVYDTVGFYPVDQFTYRGEGWGLAWDGQRFVMSDGSSHLTFREPATFKEVEALAVTLEGVPLRQLNELEMVEGEIYANVLSDDRIFRIDPGTGKVRAVIDASRLLTAAERRRAGVLNGIAFDPATKTFWITGKYWPKMFQVLFVSAPSSTGS